MNLDELMFSAVIWRIYFYSILQMFQPLWPVDKNKFPSLFVSTLSPFIFVVLGGKNGTFWLKPLKLAESFSDVKVDSHQKGIKGPISASMCRVMYTVPNMKCFLLSRLLFAHVFFFFFFCSYYCQPRLPGGFCTL